MQSRAISANLRCEPGPRTGPPAVLGGKAATPMIRNGLHVAHRYLLAYWGLLLFALMCLVWSATAAVLRHLLSREQGRVLGRLVTSYGFRCYLWTLELTGVG